MQSLLVLGALNVDALLELGAGVDQVDEQLELHGLAAAAGVARDSG